MTDIVERLRRFAAVVQGRDPKDYAVPVPAVLIIETADEIERLREALRECANYLEEQTGIAYNYLREPFDDTTTRRLMRDMGRIRKARSALGDGEND